MANKILDTFLQSTYTTNQVRRRLVALKLYLNNRIFTTSDKPLEIEKADLDWLESLGEDFYKSFDRKNLSNKLKDIEASIKKLQVLTLILPIELPESKISEIGEWIRDKFQKTLIVEIKLDPSLIAGCALIWKGVYKDYSIKAKIESEQQEILGSFKKFLK